MPDSRIRLFTSVSRHLARKYRHKRFVRVSQDRYQTHFDMYTIDKYGSPECAGLAYSRILSKMFRNRIGECGQPTPDDRYLLHLLETYYEIPTVYLWVCLCALESLAGATFGDGCCRWVNDIPVSLRGWIDLPIEDFVKELCLEDTKWIQRTLGRRWRFLIRCIIVSASDLAKIIPPHREMDLLSGIEVYLSSFETVDEINASLETMGMALVSSLL